MLKLILSAAILTALVGCATTETKVVTKTEVRVVTTPKHLLAKCKATRPPDIKEYVKKTAQEKDSLMSSYAVDLLGDINKCNGQLEGIEKFQNEQLRLIEASKETP